MAVGSNLVEVDFKLAGTTTNGVVKGFGVVFSDVDKAAATRVEYFDANGVELASIASPARSEEHTSELQSRLHLVCRLLLEKKKNSASRVLTKERSLMRA